MKTAAEHRESELENTANYANYTLQKRNRKAEFPQVGDEVYGMFRLVTSELPPYKTRREQAVQKRGTITAVYSATSVRVSSGDVFEVMSMGNGLFKALA